MIIVVTPFHQEEPEILAQCMRSVHDARFPPVPVRHLLVADGGDVGRAVRAMNLAQLPTSAFPHVISLPVAHRDYGNVARGIGAIDALSRGATALAFLDADNWFEPGHLLELSALARRTEAPICTASRIICRVDGSPMFRDSESDGERHADTSALFLTNSAMHLAPLWAQIPRQLGPIGDRAFWAMLKATELKRAHLTSPTLCYRTRYRVHYEALGEVPPASAKGNAEAPPFVVRMASQIPWVQIA